MLARREDGIAGFSELWKTLWDTYLEETNDQEVLEIVPPYLAWRLLVVAHPKWYPDTEPAVRHALLTLAEDALEAGRFDPASVTGEVF